MDWYRLMESCSSFTSVKRMCRFLYKTESDRKGQKIQKAERRKALLEREPTSEDFFKWSVPISARDTETKLWERLRVQTSPNPLIVDLGFPHLSPREMKEVYKQLGDLCYVNAKHAFPFNLQFTSACDNTRVKETLDAKADYFPSAYLRTEPFWELFDKDQLVYLSPDAPKITKFSGDEIFVIGGIVDLHNSDPITYGRARKLGLRRASLPLHDYCVYVNVYTVKPFLFLGYFISWVGQSTNSISKLNFLGILIIILNP